ncbi:MAG TPA: HDIG domain-containing protein [Gaiellales bacterium]|nr:HDIG domain-containing protein [Gaiellales bacterium]
MDGAIERDRDAAWTLLTEWTHGQALLRHALAVEAATRAYARRFGEDEESWGNVALLHDFDYERHPTLDRHPMDGAPALRERGYPEWFVRAVQAHADHTGVARESRLERTLYACDEMSGFVHACGLVRPDGIATLEPPSVRRKLRQKSFARGVDRDDVVAGAEQLGVDLDEHIAFVIAALRPIAPQLGLAG